MPQQMHRIIVTSRIFYIYISGRFVKFETVDFFIDEDPHVCTPSHRDMFDGKGYDSMIQAEEKKYKDTKLAFEFKGSIDKRETFDPVSRNILQDRKGGHTPTGSLRQ